MRNKFPLLTPFPYGTAYTPFPFSIRTRIRITKLYANYPPYKVDTVIGKGKQREHEEIIGLPKPVVELCRFMRTEDGQLEVGFRRE